MEYTTKNSEKWQEIHDCLVKSKEGNGKERSAINRNNRQSISENNSKRVARGCDTGKKIKGGKRHITVDTLGLIVTSEVNSAGFQDRDGAWDLLIKEKQKTPTLRDFCSPRVYSNLKNQCLFTIAKKILNMKDFRLFQIDG